MLRIPLNTVLFLSVAIFHATRAEKSVAAKGNLTCDGFPAGQILVRLFGLHEDSIELLEQTHSDEAGRFELVGRSRSNENWRPVLNIYHDCEDAKNPTEGARSDFVRNYDLIIFRLTDLFFSLFYMDMPGRRKMNFLLPRKYVTEGATPQSVFDLGAWNLQTSVKEDEERVDKITRRRRRGGEKTKAVARERNSTLDRYENPDDRVDPW